MRLKFMMKMTIHVLLEWLVKLSFVQRNLVFFFQDITACLRQPWKLGEIFGFIRAILEKWMKTDISIFSIARKMLFAEEGRIYRLMKWNVSSMIIQRFSNLRSSACRLNFLKKK